MTDLLFNQDSYLKETEASIIGVEENIIKLDRGKTGNIFGRSSFFIQFKL